MTNGSSTFQHISDLNLSAVKPSSDRIISYIILELLLYFFFLFLTFFVCQELTLCKAILKEYADKINVGNPIYKTEQGDGSSAFTSSLTFNGKEYVGEAGRNKKESQHLAARAVIMSVLGT